MTAYLLRQKTFSTRSWWTRLITKPREAGERSLTRFLRRSVFFSRRLRFVATGKRFVAALYSHTLWLQPLRTTSLARCDSFPPNHIRRIALICAWREPPRRAIGPIDRRA